MTCLGHIECSANLVAALIHVDTRHQPTSRFKAEPGHSRRLAGTARCDYGRDQRQWTLFKVSLLMTEKKHEKKRHCDRGAAMA